MQIVELTVDHYNFFCPVTGARISTHGDPEVNFAAASLRGYWVSEALESPNIFAEDFETAYHAYLKRCSWNSDEDGDAGDSDYVLGWEELEDFLKEFNRPNWTVFNVTTRLGDQDVTNAWYVIDLSERKV